jgi:pyruvate-ferredoxin/flavodoxin oxidoreductase
VPRKGVYTMIESGDGGLIPTGLSRQMVLFTVERRKAWRMLQSKAGIVNYERIGQERMLREFDLGLIPADYFHANVRSIYEKAVEVARELGPNAKDKKNLMEHLGVTA